MRAALLIKPGEIEIGEIAKPEIGDQEVLIQIKSCGVCATDVKKYAGASKAPHLPFILGHEPAGIIVGMGSGVGSEFSVNQRVAIAPVFTCGHCFACKTGLVYSEGMGACEHYQVLGFSMDGAFAEYVKADAKFVHPIPDELSFRDAALIEPVAACANAALRANPNPPGTALVIGAGFMGLVTIQLLKLLGNRVIVSELDLERREVALRLGADLVVDPSNEELATVIASATGKAGADSVICSVGGKAVTEEALSMTRKGGTLMLLASAPTGTKFEVDLNKLHYDQSRITGSVSYTGNGYNWSMQLLTAKKLAVDSLITSTGPLEDCGNFLQMTKDLVGLKKVVMM